MFNLPLFCFIIMPLIEEPTGNNSDYFSQYIKEIKSKEWINKLTDF